MGAHVFISYRHGPDRAYVEQLAAHLRGGGVVVWFDLELISGDRWERVLRAKIATAAAVVVIMTPEAERSQWVNREVEHAELTGRPIMPVLLAGEAFARLNEIQFEDVRGGRLPGVEFTTRIQRLVDLEPIPFLTTTRSAYLLQVARIAPEQLTGRAAELAELAAFCTADDERRYAYWRGPAWAGTSALMAWFVLHPPPGVRVVSFFITARFAGQNDRTAFTEVVLEQLSEVLDQPPVPVSDATRDLRFLDLLAMAAQRCLERGERLVLVVDGLDEDRGVTAGPDSYSIAALLPARPPAGVRVIVSGRTNPPIPTDVPEQHPLRRPEVVRPLAISAFGQVVRADAHRELRQLLRGEPIEQDVLGLIVAAAGGLSQLDLAELAGWPPWQVGDYLAAVSGRTFVGQAGSWPGEGASPRYALGHEELQQTAVTYFGERRLDAYRHRLYDWADGYRERGWPPETPDYLLRDYVSLLRSVDDGAALVALAVDRHRHARLLDRTGSDSAALAEIATALRVGAARDDPDLPGQARLAIHRDFLNSRNNDLPEFLPALYVTLGQAQRGGDLLLAMTESSGRQDAARAFVYELVSAGRDDEAQQWLVRLSGQDADPVILDRATATIVTLLMEAGRYERAADVASAVTTVGPHLDQAVRDLRDELASHAPAEFARLRTRFDWPDLLAAPPTRAVPAGVAELDVDELRFDELRFDESVRPSLIVGEDGYWDEAGQSPDPEPPAIVPVLGWANDAARRGGPVPAPGRPVRPSRGGRPRGRNDCPR